MSGSEIACFLENRLFFAVAPDHPLAHCDTVAFDQLAEYAVLLREDGSGTRSVLTHIFSERGLTMHVAMELRHSAAIKQAVMADLGVGLLSEHETRPVQATGMLVALEVQGLRINHDWHIIHRRDRPLPRAALAFKSELLRYAADYAHRSER
jgi:LysR family transcriptional regulator, low CO2-responsive transcriptional regulator